MTADEDLPITVCNSLESVYADKEKAEIRFQKLKSVFADFFQGHSPDVYTRSPGRVNLIGEHIDYEGYSVLPMAICQDTIVAIRKRGREEPKELRIVNVDSKYQMCTYPADPYQVYDISLRFYPFYLIFIPCPIVQAIDLQNLKWGHYFICG